MPVPLGFAVTTDAYGLALAGTGLDRRLRARLDGIQVNDVSTLAAISEELRAWFEAVEIPGEIEEAIRQSYVALGEKYSQVDVSVAVRSSAVAEDLPDASFAGQHDTRLWIHGLGGILQSLTQCWSSLFTVRAISYRCQKGFPHDNAAMGVAIQKMVNAKTAGVACTLNPVNGDRSKVVIDASWGFGEAVVRGEVTPDQYMVDKVVMEIVKRTVSHKYTEYTVDAVNGCIRRQQVLPERQGIPCLRDEEILAVAQMAQRLEAHAGQPQYLEWAIDTDLSSSESVVILQRRPETVWSRRPRPPVI